MRINPGKIQLNHAPELLFIFVLILIVPGLLVIDRFRYFLFLYFLELLVLMYVFINPLASLVIHFSLLFVLLLRTVIKSSV